MKRPSLSLLIFLAVLATAAVVALGMGLAAHWSFSRGFMGYLNTQALGQMEASVPRLAAAYAERGDWDFLRHRPGAWFRLTEPPPPREGPGSWDGNVDAIAPHLLGAGRRMSLLDPDGRLVVGFPGVQPQYERRPIVVDGRTVGWIALAPLETVTDAAALAFQHEQWRGSLGAGALALLLAGLTAAWVARALLAPVRRVADATHALAAGRYDTRVPENGPAEIGRLAHDFNQLARTLERNEQLRRDYMADISHELRTPLAVLRGEIEAMQDGIHPLDQRGLQVLHGEVQALGTLVADLHELALADVGALSYRLRPLALGPLLQEQAQAFEARAAERGLVLALDLPEQALRVDGDEQRLAQLLHNLLENALRYTDGPGSIELALAADGADAVLTLQDSAPGVPPEALPRLFERFYRVESSRGREGGGSGLGLSICRSIAQAHGGRLAADASPLGGLRVTLRLPLAGDPA